MQQRFIKLKCDGRLSKGEKFTDALLHKPRRTNDSYNEISWNFENVISNTIYMQLFNWFRIVFNISNARRIQRNFDTPDAVLAPKLWLPKVCSKIK